MRTSRSTKILFAVVCFARGLWADSFPYIIEVQSESPLYEKPSAKSASVANAEEKMLLLFAGKSRRGIWIKVRDVDGFEAWIPANKTDYPAIERIRASNAENQDISSVGEKKRENPVPKEETKEEESESASSIPGYRLSPLFRMTTEELPHTPRIGLRFDWLSGLIPLSGQKMGQSFWGVEGTFPFDSGGEFSAALRSSWRIPFMSYFFYGPDLGYAVDRLKSSKFRHHLSVGVSGGVLAGPFDVTLRGGYDLFANSRASIEIQLGWLF